MLISFAALIVGMLLLIWSADQFIDGAAGLAHHLGLSPLLVGMLIVGFGTSAPELLVSSMAALQGNAGLGIGNAIGSNIANIALVLGITAILVKLPISSRLVKIELPLILLSGILAFGLMYHDHSFSKIDGWILAISLVFIISSLTYFSLKSPTQALTTEACTDIPDLLSFKASIFWTIVGLIILVISSKLLVWSATNIAVFWGVSDLIIGLTVVAIGTSLPELAASISSALKKEIDLVVGMVIGSNMFNTLGVLALPGIIGTSHIPEGVLERDMPFMLGITALLLILAIYRHTIGRWKGAVLLACFVIYEGIVYYQAII